jgi:hypothetical protein
VYLQQLCQHACIRLRIRGLAWPCAQHHTVGSGDACRLQRLQSPQQEQWIKVKAWLGVLSCVHWEPVASMLLAFYVTLGQVCITCKTAVHACWCPQTNCCVHTSTRSTLRLAAVSTFEPFHKLLQPPQCSHWLHQSRPKALPSALRPHL